MQTRHRKTDQHEADLKKPNRNITKHSCTGHAAAGILTQNRLRLRTFVNRRAYGSRFVYLSGSMESKRQARQGEDATGQ